MTNTITGLLDLTLLNEDASSAMIEALAIKANDHHVAAICVLPQHLQYIPENVSIKRATVVNFPCGNDNQDQVIDLINTVAMNQKIDEIDYVFPYQNYLAGNTQEALSHCLAAYQCSKRHGLIFKVILETGALPSTDLIYQLSVEVIKSGCDFLKTSTGKINVGATLPAATAMLSAIKNTNNSCGIKLSGGIRTLEQALAFMQLAEEMLGKPCQADWFRIGTSNLISENHSG